jgi:BolA protein
MNTPMNNEARMREMQRRLKAALQPTKLEIEDQSHLHAGHAGAKEGKGHFKVTIASAAFAGQTPIQQHRLVYEALGTLMQTDIHAVTIAAATD